MTKGLEKPKDIPDVARLLCAIGGLFCIVSGTISLILCVLWNNGRGHGRGWGSGFCVFASIWTILIGAFIFCIEWPVAACANPLKRIFQHYLIRGIIWLLFVVFTFFGWYSWIGAVLVGIGAVLYIIVGIMEMAGGAAQSGRGNARVGPNPPKV